MIPCELIKDKDGLLYYRNDDILRQYELMIDKRKNVENRYYQNGFYSIPSTDEYIVKFSYTCFTRKEIKEIKYMLECLQSKQKDIPDIDFPIAYFTLKKRLSGLIVKYYKDGISCDNIFELQDIETLGKYYYHDEDNIRNLFILYDELLKLVFEMFENGIYYTDVNPGNIIIKANELKIIDFDPHYVLFDRKDERLRIILNGYNFFLKKTLEKLKLNSDILDNCYNFDDTKKYLKTLENKIRKG